MGFARRYEELHARCNEVLQIDPQNLVAITACVYGESDGGYADAASVRLKKLEPTLANLPVMCLVRAYNEVRRGDVASARADYQAFAALDRRTREELSFEESVTLLALGDRERALARLDDAFVHANPAMAGVDPAWDAMREDADFRALLKRRAPQVLAVSDRQVQKATRTAHQ